MTGARRQGPGERPLLELWLIETIAERHQLEAAEHRQPRLDANERARALAFQDPLRGAEWRTAHIALRLALEASTGDGVRGLSYRITPAGRPALPFADAPDFSLAHTDGLALIAVAGSGPVGIDIERIRPVKLAADRMTRLIDAGAALAGGGENASSPPSDAAVIRAWTRLEAFGKARGTGIGPVLSDCDIAGRTGPLLAASAARARLAAERTGLLVRDLDVGRAGVCAAIAAPATLLSSQYLCDIGDVGRLLETVERRVS